MSKDTTFTPRNYMGEPLTMLKASKVQILGIDLVVHKTPADESRWNVSDPVSGCHIAQWMESKKAALKEAERIISYRGVELFMLARASMVAKFADAGT